MYIKCFVCPLGERERERVRETGRVTHRQSNDTMQCTVSSCEGLLTPHLTLCRGACTTYYHTVVLLSLCSYLCTIMIVKRANNVCQAQPYPVIGTHKFILSEFSRPSIFTPTLTLHHHKKFL